LTIDYNQGMESKQAQAAEKREKQLRHAEMLGYSAGYRARSTDNPYSVGSEKYEAWRIGREDSIQDTI
jgi:hypothetical protein